MYWRRPAGYMVNLQQELDKSSLRTLKSWHLADGVATLFYFCMEISKSSFRVTVLRTQMQKTSQILSARDEGLHLRAAGSRAR